MAVKQLSDAQWQAAQDAVAQSSNYPLAAEVIEALRIEAGLDSAGQVCTMLKRIITDSAGLEKYLTAGRALGLTDVQIEAAKALGIPVNKLPAWAQTVNAPKPSRVSGAVLTAMQRQPGITHTEKQAAITGKVKAHKAARQPVEVPEE